MAPEKKNAIVRDASKKSLSFIFFPGAIVRDASKKSLSFFFFQAPLSATPLKNL